MKKNKNLIIIGAGFHASNVVGVANALGYDVSAFVHNTKHGDILYGKPIIDDLSRIDNIDGYDVFLALGDNYQREKYLSQAILRYPMLKFPSLIHPSAVIGPFCKIGDGTLIMPGSVVGTSVEVGSFCLLGNQSCVGHDSYLSDFSSLAPAATLAGNIRIGVRSSIGIGAKIREKVIVGDDSILGANSFLNDDLPSNVVAYGTPAKVKKNRISSDAYLR